MQNSSKDQPVTVITNLQEFLSLFERNTEQCLRLDLAAQGINHEEIKVIAKALEKCPRNFQLFLGANNINSNGIKIFAEVLKSGKCQPGLQLHFEANNINDDGAKAIAEALKINCIPGLQINLENNYISSEGAKAIADALCANTTATKIILFSDDTESEYSKIIRHCCLRNALIERHQHQPDLIDYIKRLSHAAGLYLPSYSLSSKLNSLKLLTAFSLLRDKENIENYDEILSSLASENDHADLFQYVNELDTLRQQINPAAARLN